MQEVIKAHVATIGYEDGNPFSLLGWAIEVAQAGYIHLVEQEFAIYALTSEDKITYDAYDEDDLILIPTLDPDEIADRYDDISIYKLVIQPISKLRSYDGGDIEATRV